MALRACLKKEMGWFWESMAGKKADKTLDLTGYFCGFHSR
jgi:hypothetical protein